MPLFPLGDVTKFGRGDSRPCTPHHPGSATAEPVPGPPHSSAALSQVHTKAWLQLHWPPLLHRRAQCLPVWAHHVCEWPVGVFLQLQGAEAGRGDRVPTWAHPGLEEWVKAGVPVSSGDPERVWH